MIEHYNYIIDIKDKELAELYKQVRYRKEELAQLRETLWEKQQDDSNRQCFGNAVIDSVCCYTVYTRMNDLKNFFKRKSRRHSRGPVKVACTTKGPAVTTSTYYIKRMIPLVIVLGSHWGQQGPAVNKVDDPRNDNSLQQIMLYILID